MVDTIHIDIDFANRSAAAPNAETQSLVELLKAVGDEHRLEILKMLGNGEMCACEIHGPLGIPQNLASHHLRTLRVAGLVKTRRRGRSIIYSLDPARLRITTELLNNLVKKGDE